MKQYITLFFMFVFPTALFAQKLTNEQIESDLIRRYEKIVSFPYSYLGTEATLDSIAYFDSLFAKNLVFYTTHDPSTLTYSFDSLKEQISIATSPDGRFRIYSWDTRDGGIMHNFSNVFQFKSGNKVYSKLSADTGTDSNYDPGVSYKKIVTLKAPHQTYYLALGEGRYSTGVIGQRFKAFTIGGHSLNDTVKIINKKNGHWIN